MSLINKMLMELEERHPEEQAFGALQGQLRAAPEVSRPRVPKWVAWACALPLCGAAAWIAHKHDAFLAPPRVKEQVSSFHLRMSTGLDHLPAAAQDLIVSEGSTPPMEPIATSFSNEPPHGATGNDSLQTAISVKPYGMGKLVSSTNKSSAQSSGTESSVQRAPLLAGVAANPVQKNVKEKNPSETSHKEGINAGRISRPADLLAEPAAQSALRADAATAVPFAKQFKELTAQQRAENEYRRASNFIQQGKQSEAISALEQAVHLDPQHMPAFQTLIGIMIDSKRHEEAIHKLQEKLHHDRSYAQLAMMLARLQIDRGETRNAIDTLQKSLPHASHRSDYQAFLAALYQRDGRNKEAVELYMLALGKSPQNGIWWMGLGISMQTLNRLPEARDAFRQARENNLPSADLQAFVEQKLTQLQ